MALTIKDILQLQSLQGFQLEAGQKGLSRYVTSAGIADYEFCIDIDYPREHAFEPDSLVISSLLFAKESPQLLLPAMQMLSDAGVSGLAYKTVIYSKLPEDVLDFCEEHDFPLFSFGNDTYFENIIYEVMNAVRADDTNLLTEANIRRLIATDYPKSQIPLLAKSLSLSFKQYVMGVYFKSKASESEQDSFYQKAERAIKTIYLNRNLNGKALLCLYDGGLFGLLTAQQPKSESFGIILSQLLEFLNFEKSELYVCRSDIHTPYDELGQCFRESFHAYLASVAESHSFESYSGIGTYQFLIPQKDDKAMQAYAAAILKPLLDRPEYYETIRQLVLCGGDALLTAQHFGCHQNTIRYRLQKIEKLLGLENQTEQDFYAILSIAMRIRLLQ